jgi:hypothetical protein
VSGTEDRSWRAFGASVRGAAHVRDQSPNQDAIAWQPASGQGAPLVLAVADGHGGAAYVHSAQGARLAVEAAIATLTSVLDAPFLGTRPDPGEIATRIVAGWRARVDALLTHPSADAARFIPYGTTLLAAALGAEHAIYLQLGDGDVITLDDAGKLHRPFPPDPRHVGNVTTSLCLPDAEQLLRVIILPRDKAPAMIALATDGYANSFADDSGFLRAWRDMAGNLARDGVDRLAHALEGWLSETSRLGSGDDITVGLLVRLREDTADLFAAGTLVPTPQDGAAVAAALAPQLAVLQRRVRRQAIVITILGLALLLAGAATFLLGKAVQHEAAEAAGCTRPPASIAHRAIGGAPLAPPGTPPKPTGTTP